MATMISTGVFRTDLFRLAGRDILNCIFNGRSFRSEYIYPTALEFLQCSSAKTPADNTINPLVLQIVHWVACPVFVIVV